ncbi:MAG: TetR/AcrR family transcriptional regulator [Gammaproteobacteria bacterium]|jgi:TetR/AcrR family transcriptional repressor of nem operon
MAVQKVTTEEIAENTIRLIVKRGYAGTSMSEIGKSCGILKGSLYHHFDSKEEILLYILNRLHSELKTHVFCVADNQEISEQQRLKQINKMLKAYFLDNKGCLIGVMGMESDLIGDEAKQIMNQIFQDWKQTYIKIFKSHHTPYMAGVLATNAIIFIEGAIVWLRITGEEAPLKRVFKDIDGYLIEAA